MERTVKEEAAKGKPPTFDPFLLAVLSKRFEAIIHEMTNTVMKASRSAPSRIRATCPAASLHTITG